MWLVKEGQVPRPMAARVAEAEANGVGSVETGAPATAAAVGQVHSMRCHIASERGGGWDSVHFVWICGAVGCQSAMRASTGVRSSLGSAVLVWCSPTRRDHVEALFESGRARRHDGAAEVVMVRQVQVWKYSGRVCRAQMCAGQLGWCGCFQVPWAVGRLYIGRDAWKLQMRVCAGDSAS